jgi:hypothetical protein
MEGVAGLQAVTTTADANTSVKKWMRALPSALKLTEAASNTKYNHTASMT